MARRLRAFLLRKGTSPARVDDIVQETALRLVQMGDAVDRDRSPWPLIVTIALNLQRDEYRSASRCEIQYEVPEAAGAHDVETAGIARAELSEVMRAMTHLTKAQRAVLLGEIGDAEGTFGVTAADKMLRLRARKKLRTMVERLSAGVFVRSRRVFEVIESAFTSDGALTKMSTCLACAFVGFAATIAMPTLPGLSGNRVVLPGTVAGASTVRVADAMARPAAGHVGNLSVSSKSAPSLHAHRSKSSRRAADARNASGLPSTPSLPVDQPSLPQTPQVPVPSNPQPKPPAVPSGPVPSLPLPHLPLPGVLHR
jgi:hypothetical protein